MKLDIKKDLMSQMLHFRLELDPGTWGLTGENRNLGKCLEWRDRDDT